MGCGGRLILPDAAGVCWAATHIPQLPAVGGPRYSSRLLPPPASCTSAGLRTCTMAAVSNGKARHHASGTARPHHLTEARRAIHLPQHLRGGLTRRHEGMLERVRLWQRATTEGSVRRAVCECGCCVCRGKCRTPVPATRHGQAPPRAGGSSGRPARFHLHRWCPQQRRWQQHPPPSLVGKGVEATTATAAVAPTRSRVQFWSRRRKSMPRLGPRVCGSHHVEWSALAHATGHAQQHQTHPLPGNARRVIA